MGYGYFREGPNMKKVLLGLVGFAVLSPVAVIAGASSVPVAVESGGPEGALVLLLILGAVILLNGRGGSSAAKDTRTETQDDDSDVIMKF